MIGFVFGLVLGLVVGGLVAVNNSVKAKVYKDALDAQVDSYIPVIRGFWANVVIWFKGLFKK